MINIIITDNIFFLKIKLIKPDVGLHFFHGLGFAFSTETQMLRSSGFMICNILYKSTIIFNTFFISIHRCNSEE